MAGMNSSHLALAILTCALFEGCATAHNLKTGQVPFGGLSDDINQLRQGKQPEDIFGIGPPLVAMDAAFSLVGDAVTLPITLCAAGGRAIDESKKRDQQRERERVVTTPPAQNEPDLSEGTATVRHASPETR